MCGRESKDNRRKGGERAGGTYLQDNIRVACPGNMHVQANEVFLRLDETDARHSGSHGTKTALREGGREGGVSLWVP